MFSHILHRKWFRDCILLILNVVVSCLEEDERMFEVDLWELGWRRNGCGKEGTNESAKSLEGCSVVGCCSQWLHHFRRSYLGHSSEMGIIWSSLFKIELSMNLNNIIRITSVGVKHILFYFLIQLWKICL